MLSLLDINKIARSNPAVDAQKLQILRDVQRILEQAGVVRKADYRLAPPLGGASCKPLLPSNGSIRMT